MNAVSFNFEDLFSQLDALRGKNFSSNDDAIENFYKSSFNKSIWRQEKTELVFIEEFLKEIENTRNKVIMHLGSKSNITVSIICRTLLKFFKQTKDPRILNTIIKTLWKLSEVCSSSETKFKISFLVNDITNLFKQLSKENYFEESASDKRFTKALISDPQDAFNVILCSKAKETSIVVFCPNPHSSYTLAVLEMLKRKNFHIGAVVVKKILNIRRIRKELKRDGERLLHKIYRKLILKDSFRIDPNGRNLSDVIEELNIPKDSVYSWCKKNNVKVIKCDDLNSSIVVSELDRLGYQYGIFTGGGILSDDLLNTANIGILNCHAGLLPYYRGMDVIEWPVLLGDAANIGSTVHFMTSSIDEGDILLGYKMNKKLDVRSARYELESQWPYLLINALSRHVNSTESETQQKMHGKHFYVLHKTLFDYALELSANKKYI